MIKAAYLFCVCVLTSCLILVATYSRHLEVMKDMTVRNVDLEAKHNDGMTPIALAARAGQLGLVNELPEFGVPWSAAPARKPIK